MLRLARGSRIRAASANFPQGLVVAKGSTIMSLCSLELEGPVVLVAFRPGEWVNGKP